MYGLKYFHYFVGGATIEVINKEYDAIDLLEFFIVRFVGGCRRFVSDSKSWRIVEMIPRCFL